VGFQPTSRNAVTFFYRGKTKNKEIATIVTSSYGLSGSQKKKGRFEARDGLLERKSDGGDRLPGTQSRYQ